MRQILFTLLAVLGLSLVACGAPTTAQQVAQGPAPTRTPRPTWTPLIPTPTLVPTPTPLLEKSGPEVATRLRKALDQTTELATYRMQYTLEAKSVKRWRSAEVAGKMLARPDLAQIDLDKKFPLVTLTGEYQGTNARTTTIYHCIECQDGDEDRKFDMLTVDGALYMLYGSNTWFVVDQSMSADSQAAFQGHKLLRRLLNERVDLASFQATRFETIDKHECAVYADYGRAAVGALAGMYAVFGENEDTVINEAINSIHADESALKLWACDDGYLHRLTIELTGYQKDYPDQPFALSQELRLYDVGAKIAISAPAGAVRLDPRRQSDQLTATVFNGGNIREQPTLDGAVVGQLKAGETVELLERSGDGRWYYVSAPAGEGWAHSSLLNIDPTVAAQVPISGQAAEPAQPAPQGGAALTATVFNGGNVRAAPGGQGQVLDQINANETVELLGKSADSTWFNIRDLRGIVGWVHRSLLTIDPGIEAQVPTA